MDKLKPIIVHKFWIILFIALLLPVIGWSMATGSLAKEIEERKSAIDQAFTSAQVPANPPNQTWSTALQQINKEKDYAIGLSWKKLWDKQKSLFVWPPDIEPLMKDTPYRADISRVPRNLYRSAYKFEVLRAHKLANPFNLRDGTGLVNLDPNVIPHVPLDKWKTLPPTSKEMWDAQEDIWLVSSILQAIAKVNSSAPNISEAAVRQISVLELRGGTFGEDGGDGGDGGGDMGMDGEMIPGGGGGALFGGGGGQAGMADGGGIQNVDIDMDLSEIFGDDADTSDSGEEESEESFSADAGLIPGGLGGAGGGANQKRKRYYHEAEELPYKTRAFYIKAVIESGKLPNLITELTNMPWPAEIVRVQRADMFDDNLGSIANIEGGGRGRGVGGAEAGFSVDGQFGGAGSGRFGSASGLGAAADGFAENGQEGQENKGLLEAALNDPKLAVVTIAGVMTLYKPYVPPEGEVVAEMEEKTDSDTTQPASDDPSQPTDDTTTNPEPGTSPDDSTPPAENSDTNPEKQPAPAGDSPQESTEPEQPADSKPDKTEPPKTETESAETKK